MIPVGADMAPSTDYYLWCDHRAWKEAREITADGPGGRTWNQSIGAAAFIPSEWGFAKLLHWLRHNPEKRGDFVTAFEHCDMVAAVLCGITDPDEVPRSICAMGHKWMWNAGWGSSAGDFLAKVDPLLAGVRAKIDGRYATSDKIAGKLSGNGRKNSDCGGHPDSRRRVRRALGRDRRRSPRRRHRQRGRHLDLHHRDVEGRADSRRLRRGSGIGPSAIHRHRGGAFRHRRYFRRHRAARGTTVAELSRGLEKYRAGETGLLRLTWDNGDRTVLVNPELSGITLGWRLTTTAQDELFAAIEGTAFHTRVILERMEEHGVPVRRVINGGGIPQSGVRCSTRCMQASLGSLSWSLTAM